MGNTTLPRSQVIPVIAMLPMTAITSPSIIGPIISQGNLPTLINTWPNFCGPLLILVGPVTDWCQPAKNFLPKGPGKNLAIVEPKQTFSSWEAKPQFFIKGPIKKRKGGFCLYSIRLIGLFFFFCLPQLGGTLPKEQKKKKK